MCVSESVCGGGGGMAEQGEEGRVQACTGPPVMGLPPHTHKRTLPGLDLGAIRAIVHYQPAPGCHHHEGAIGAKGNVPHHSGPAAALRGRDHVRPDQRGAHGRSATTHNRTRNRKQPPLGKLFLLMFFKIFSSLRSPQASGVLSSSATFLTHRLRGSLLILSGQTEQC